MKNVGNSSDGRSQEVPKILGHPCIGRMGALRGHLCDSTAFLFFDDTMELWPRVHSYISSITSVLRVVRW